MLRVTHCGDDVFVSLEHGEFILGGSELELRLQPLSPPK